ncbi:hypothetical protein BKE30_08605 [Alkanindiges hydrocarboniclasticus]|uniref:Uncharacterized protein n=1 Tax=Alkanindiges hydrocarboniclasticus TaxID=1907941 RepID=A0A1S8CVL5_9GAMM|nr:hypothetical protein BKE30_08605 [Alkanindiges hydrocarboniclasticus]
MDKPGKGNALIITTKLGKHIEGFVKQDNLGHFDPVSEVLVQKQCVYSCFITQENIVICFLNHKNM